MSSLFTCNFELYSPEAHVIMDALRADDQEDSDRIEYSVCGSTLLVKVQTEDFRSLMKIVTFFMERFKLSADTIGMCSIGASRP